MEADFGGYATKAGLKCSDGRTITPEAFKHQDKMTVPLVWQHGHSEPSNVLGHAILEARDDGIYALGYFNATEQGKSAKQLVEHKDIKSLSIYANQLVEKAKTVLHGTIREVSLVLSGANPGALIDYVRVAHADGEVETLEDEAVIYTGLEIQHSDETDSKTEEDAESSDEDNSEESEEADADKTVKEVYDSLSDEQKAAVHSMIGSAVANADGSDASHAASSNEPTVQEVYDSLTAVQKDVVHYMIGAALEASTTSSTATHSDTENDNNQEGTEMTHNVFESDANGSKPGATLTHDQLKTIVDDAGRLGSLKESFLAHAAEYGIEDIDVLFPDATLDSNGITYVSRRMEWVNNVLTNTKHSPFSRIKSLSADLTADEARAKGYVKGNLKKDEVIRMLKRVTTPKTIYKKQKLDRDDIVDITTVDIVAWLKAEMRLMLDEEIARAVLVGDNRPADDDDKIDEDHIRPIAYDIDMYNTTVELAVDISPTDLIDAVVNAMDSYKGTGTPTLYTTQRRLTSMLLAKDTLGRRLYPTKADLAGALLVQDVIAVEAMEQDSDLVGVIVNLTDYTIGADQGGNVSMFDNFDIDYNQQRYLIETRISGALTKPKSAITLKVNSGRVVTPTAPTFVTSTGVLTVPSQTGVVYKDADTGATLSSGAQTAIAPGASVDVEAVPANGYGFTHDADTEWGFTRDAS
jgi:hypothetical protein